VQGHRSTPAHPRLLVYRTAGHAEVMGDSSLPPFPLRRDGDRRARHGDRRPAAWQADGQAKPSLAQSADTRRTRLKSFRYHFAA
jgi:hypothetical protein